MFSMTRHACARPTERAMELFVEHQELLVMPRFQRPLFLDQAAQFLDGARRRGRCGLLSDGDFDRFAHEAGVEDVGYRNLDHERAALRQDIDQAFFGQFDERFAYRLTAGRILARKLRFGQGLTRMDFSAHDGAAQMAVELGADGHRFGLLEWARRPFSLLGCLHSNASFVEDQGLPRHHVW
jgi:hypothetical protein